MATISDKTRNSFEAVCKGVHSNFNEQEIAKLDRMAAEVKAILAASLQRQKESMARV